MRYKTLFRLAVKWLGVVLIAFGAVHLVQGAAWYLNTHLAGYSTGPHWALHLAATCAGPVAYLCVGTYLFLGGAWLVDHAIPSNRPYCPECGFDLTRNASPLCPECGTALPAESLCQIGTARQAPAPGLPRNESGDGPPSTEHRGPDA